MIIEQILTILGIYLLVGLVFGLLFAFWGAKRIDHGAEAGTLGFKLMIIPGCAVFWPYLLGRWITGRQPAQECSRHRGCSGN